MNIYIRSTLITHCFFLCFIVAIAQKKVYNINNYGAKTDGVYDNKNSLQRAIDAAYTAGGGQVVIPDGYYLTGQIYLKSGVELHLSDYAVLLGTTNRLDFNPKPTNGLINASDQKNISITGKGTIDGRGRDLVVNLLQLLTDGKVQDKEWKTKRPGENNRPSIISFNSCAGVKITGVHIKDAAGWVQNYTNCTDMIIDDMHVESMAYWNNDGIDLVDCKRVKLTNSSFNAADDAICLKSEQVNRSCEDIEVENCILRSSASGLKLGTGSFGAFRRIKVRNLTVYNTYRSAIALESVDGAVIEDVDIRGVNVKNSGNTFFIRLGHRNTDDRFSIIRRIRIADVKAEIPSGKPDIGYPVEGPPPKVAAHNLVPSSIIGIPGHPVQNVTLENIEISYGGGAHKEVANVPVDQLASVTENISGYPEFTMFGELPAWGVYVRHADGIVLNNVTLSVKEADFRPACVFDDLKTVKLNKVLVADGNRPAIILHNVEQPSFNQINNQENTVHIQQ